MKKEQKGLREFRREWIKMTKGMDFDDCVVFMDKFVGKAYWYAPGGIWHIVEIDDITSDGKKFIIKSVKKVKGRTKEIHPWYILRAAEVDKKEIPDCSDQVITERCYQLIWDKWGKHLASQLRYRSKLGNAVHHAKKSITAKFCPYYEETHAWKIWNDALNDLSRKMHPTYIPVNSKGEVLWDAV